MRVIIYQLVERGGEMDPVISWAICWQISHCFSVTRSFRFMYRSRPQFLMLTLHDPQPIAQPGAANHHTS